MTRRDGRRPFLPAAQPAAPAHLAAHARAVLELSRHSARLAAWGEHLAAVLLSGGRLLTAGNRATLQWLFLTHRPLLPSLAMSTGRWLRFAASMGAPERGT